MLTGKISLRHSNPRYNSLGYSGGEMDFLSGLAGNINFEAIAQLTFVALIMLAGPAVIFVLAARRGDL